MFLLFLWWMVSIIICCWCNVVDEDDIQLKDLLLYMVTGWFIGFFGIVIQTRKLGVLPKVLNTVLWKYENK